MKEERREVEEGGERREKEEGEEEESIDKVAVNKRR